MKRYPHLELLTVNRQYMERINDACRRVAESGRYVGGPEVEGFERELALASGSARAVGVSNGLDALRLIFKAYKALGVMEDGDEVIVPANTYIASVLAVTDCGLKPVFVEPSGETLNLDTSLIEQAISSRTRAILTVHLYGRSCFDETMKALAQHHGLKIVEDNAQAIGATCATPGERGSHTTGALGHAAAFSFYPTKNVGALGDAGAVTTDDERLADTVKALRDYGSDRRYHNIYEGYNCRLDPVQAAILRIKLPDAAAEGRYRQKIADVYSREIKNPCISTPLNTGGTECVWHQYVVRSRHRREFIDFLASRGVETAIHYPTPPHLQPCYARFSHLSLPLTERLAREVVSLPVSRCTSEADAAEIAAIINEFKPK